jgi:chromosome segregation ATPase
MSESLVIGLILGLAGTLVTVGGGLITAIIYQRKGGGGIQLRLNQNYKELADTLEKRITGQSRDLAECMDKVNKFLTDQEIEQQALEKERARWRREKLSLKQEIDDLRDQVRELRNQVADA